MTDNKTEFLKGVKLETTETWEGEIIKCRLLHISKHLIEVEVVAPYSPEEQLLALDYAYTQYLRNLDE